MTDDIEGWTDFLATSPAVAPFRRPGEDENFRTPFGFLINEFGDAMPYSSADDEEIEAGRAAFEQPTWAPVLASQKLDGYYEVADFSLTVHGMTVVAEGTGAAMFWLTNEQMLGVARSGTGLRWTDGDWKRTELGDTFRLWRWPVEDIASAAVGRVNKMFKWRDEDVIIRGRQPGAGAKGERAGVSIRDYAAGRRPEDVTEVANSFMRIAGLTPHDTGPDEVDGSAMLALVQRLAKQIGDRTDRSVTWEEDADRKEKTHQASFA